MIVANQETHLIAAWLWYVSEEVDTSAIFLASRETVVSRYSIKPDEEWKDGWALEAHNEYAKRLQIAVNDLLNNSLEEFDITRPYETGADLILPLLEVALDVVDWGIVVEILFCYADAQDSTADVDEDDAEDEDDAQPIGTLLLVGAA